MKTQTSTPELGHDPEGNYAQAQGEGLNWWQIFAAWFCFRALILVGEFERWYTVKPMCAWCRPVRWIGGNPFAKKRTHGPCFRCRARMKSEIASLKS